MIALALVTAVAPASAAGPSARTALATNAETTCPLWSSLNPEGKLEGKSPQAIPISARQVGAVEGRTEWEVSARPTKPGLELYSGVVEPMEDKPPFGLGVVGMVWMHHRGRELVARVTLKAGQVLRATACGRYPVILPPGQPYTGKGSSCKRPLKAAEAQDFEHYGDGRYIHISLTTSGPPANVTFGVPFQSPIKDLPPDKPLYYDLRIHTHRHVVICKAFIVWSNSKTGESGHYRLNAQPHGLGSFTIAAYAAWTFAVDVKARYSDGRPLGGRISDTTR